MTSSSEDSASEPHQLPVYDYAAVFEKIPGLYLILDPSFTIVAANDAYCDATLTERDAIVGRHLFEAFPDNPQDSAADGVENLRGSLLRVLKTRQPDRMNIQKYDIRRHGSEKFEARHWSPLNIPLIGSDGYVKWIIHSVEDVTELMNLRAEFAAKRDTTTAQRILAQLRATERELDAERSENAELRETIRRAKG